jgi:outer membrane cobalamin receptor/copper chaperone CopZ
LLLNTIFIFSQDNPRIKNIQFKVFGNCEMCKERIETAAKIRGVQYADWNIESKILTIRYDTVLVTLSKIENKIVEAGHDLENKKASDITYATLPECCLYRKKPTESISLQDLVRGVVLKENAKGKYEALKLASVYWLGTSVGTRTDSLGVFSLEKTDNSQKLVISYAGFTPDTIDVKDQHQLMVVLATNGKLSEVVVTSKLNSTYASLLNPVRTEIMTGRELLKAACCNLSESFETNPSVDVSYNDAVTGSKQIQLLGLSGIYTQLTVENLPGPRGLSTPLGLNSIAGPWIESIQLTKGTGSVANGFESIAGQINVELKKPSTADPLLANVYVNSMGKADVNLNFFHKISKDFSAGLLLHGDWLTNRVDENGDGFKDLPTGRQWSLINRYEYHNSKGVFSEFGIQLLNDKKVGGQIKFVPSLHQGTMAYYGLGINTERYELFGKLGYVFPQSKYKSIGLQLSTFSHKQDAYFGLTRYDGTQHNIYANLIYQSIIGSTIHKFRTGLSFVSDNYDESIRGLHFARVETVPGAFFEYTFTPNTKFSAVAGIRGDANNLFGSFFTPRLNLRYQLFKKTTIRASIGRGQRTANIFAENNTVFASSRQINLIPETGVKGYGFRPEIAWNKGITIDQEFRMFENKADITIDYFRNDFVNQVVVDNRNPRLVRFYNLTGGPSFSNSVQASLNFLATKAVSVKLAYRYFDVRQTKIDILTPKALIAKNRAFASADYSNKKGWKFNWTVTYSGPKPIPSTKTNPFPYKLDSFSPSYFQMNTQLTKSFSHKIPMDIYIGIENLTNFRQENPILAANDPFGPYFDASLVWGPITGRMYYIGWRMKLKK